MTEWEYKSFFVNISLDKTRNQIRVDSINGQELGSIGAHFYKKLGFRDYLVHFIMESFKSGAGLSLDEFITEFGAQGWKLVGVNDKVYIFERQRISTEQGFSK